VHLVKILHITTCSEAYMVYATAGVLTSTDHCTPMILKLNLEAQF
jgi:hypothetical protein